MNLREKIQDGFGRPIASVIVPIFVIWSCFHWWPAHAAAQEKLLAGLQKVAFVAAAFAVTAYNLRTRVVDLVLRIDAKPSRVKEFCRIARVCGRRLTNLVILFTSTAVWLGGLTVLKGGDIWTQLAVCGALGLLAASVVSFVYIVFAFERLERFALDEAEHRAEGKEAERLFQPSDT